MATNKPNTLLRILVPLTLAGVAVFAAWAVLVNTSRSTGGSSSASPPAAAAPATPPTDAAETVPAAQPDEQPGDPAADPAPASVSSPDQPSDDAPADQQPGAGPAPESAPEPMAVGLRARRVAAGASLTPIGSVDPDAAKLLALRFSRIGAGVESIRLAQEFKAVADRTAYRATGKHDPDDHVEVQSERTNRQGEVITPFAALWAEVDNAIVGLASPEVWRETAPGSFEAIIETAEGEPVARVTRRYVIEDGSLDVLVRQRVENLSDRARSVRVVSFGPVDLPQDAVTYGGDKRRLRFGYLSRPELDPSRSVVVARKFLMPRQSALGPKPYAEVSQVWPNATSVEAGFTLVWTGMTNRYFAVVVHGVVTPPAPDQTASVDKSFETVETVERVLLADPVDPASGTMILRLKSPEVSIEPGRTADLSYRFYAGPSHEPTIRRSPAAAAAGVDEVVVYNFGGPCAACTFSWLTAPLIDLLRLLHTLIPDWSVAIILLVVCVRGVLHPVNRWSQIRVQRFSKQMQDMAPKQKKIQEKYKDDRQRMQQEMAKLWREEGVNPAGMLGCLPMLLQSPIWIALYASLYFFYDLRHEPAFFGAIQAVTGGNWLFLADLAEPDHFVPLPASWQFTVPLMGLISSVNVLPLVLAFVYYAHMKFLTPPTSATLTPEQEQTQKIAKMMTVVLFPVIMYNAPSGLAIYFIANSGLAIAENTWIRRHITKHDLLEVKKKPRKKSGFLARLQQIAEQQQALREQQKQGGLRRPGQPSESAAQRAMRKGHKRP